MDLSVIIERICYEKPFFTSLLLSLSTKEDNSIETLGTDGYVIIYNKDFISGLTETELCAVVLHEALHCAFSHISRKGDKDMDVWNRATDYAINPIVSESYSLPSGSLLDMQYYGMSAEEIYNDLKNKKSEDDQGKKCWCDKSKWSEDETTTNSSEDQKKIENFEKAILKDYKDLPSSLKRIVEKKYFIPTIDWSTLVSSILSEDTSDYTFSSRDRRFLDSNFFIPNLYSENSIKDVVFAYDTSGSISEDLLNSYHLETINLVNSFSDIKGWSAVCDCVLYSFSEIDIEREELNINFNGGGGTSFTPVFEEVSNRGIRPKALFYFTDLMGSFPEEHPNYPVFWLVKTPIQKQKPKDITPFGEVIYFL